MKDQYENQSQSRNESEELKKKKDDDSDKDHTSNYSETFSGLKRYFQKSSKEVTEEQAKKMGAIPKGSKIVSSQNTNESEKLKIKLSSLKIEEEQTSTSGCKPFQETQNKKDDDSDKDDKFKSSEKNIYDLKKDF
ncbi:hypothetical protein [Spiroplasma endosymbiont of Colias croceus]|uniref:hypothetical protein n=1 Tax=Spiroplasma endosymbiont of Colias croceus TaxID=3066310 RepID=UPI0030D18AF5